MTLANMRENGVRSLSVTCELCHHEAVMNVTPKEKKPGRVRRGFLYAGSDSGKPAAFDLIGRHLRNYHDGKRIRTLPVNDWDTVVRG
jgi:hypothetical protein